MKTLILAFASFFTFAVVHAQDALPKIENDTLYTTVGYKIGKGQVITIGKGSTPDGEFLYIRRNTKAAISLNNPGMSHNGENVMTNSFPKRQYGQTFEVKKLRKDGNRKRGYNYMAIINSGPTKYEIDVENAIASGELKVPDGYRPKTTGVIEASQGSSVADELRKVKKLYDDGILTKEEYEAQKKKLLEKQ